MHGIFDGKGQGEEQSPVSLPPSSIRGVGGDKAHPNMRWSEHRIRPVVIPRAVTGRLNVEKRPFKALKLPRKRGHPIAVQILPVKVTPDASEKVGVIYDRGIGIPVRRQAAIGTLIRASELKRNHKSRDRVLHICALRFPPKGI